MYRVHLLAAGAPVWVEGQMDQGSGVLVIQLIVDGFGDVLSVEGDVVDRQSKRVYIKGNDLTQPWLAFQTFQKLGADVTGCSGYGYYLSLLGHLTCREIRFALSID